MKRLFLAAALMVAAFTFTYMNSANAKTSYLPNVNTTCGTSYDCGICHVNPFGGGTLTTEGQEWVEFGRDNTLLCPVEPDPIPGPGPGPVPPPTPGPGDGGDSDGDSDSD